MTPRERVTRALTFQQPDRPPRELWALRGVLWDRADEHAALCAAYPPDIVTVGIDYQPSRLAQGTVGELGRYRDEYGSVWNVAERGVIGEVVEPALPAWDALADFSPPWEMLQGASANTLQRTAQHSDLYVRAATSIRPFERLQFLRGTENLLLDLAYGAPELETLRDKLHAYYLAELDLVLATDCDGVGFLDDWGTQRSLLISPDLWRSFFKPLYGEYCARIRAAGKHVWFHSDGFIEPIYGDLIEIGVHAVNSQLFCMDIEAVGTAHAGRIVFWGEIDRQGILPFGTPGDVAAAVRRVRLALDTGRGGVVAQCEWGLRDPRENVEAVFAAWNKPHPDPARRYPAEGA